jgi:hypothetical protein
MKKQSQNKQYIQKLFGGIIVNVDPIDIKEKNAVDAYNIDLQIIGELKNTNGYTKKIITGLGYAIDTLMQIKGYNFVLYNGTYAYI